MNRYLIFGITVTAILGTTAWLAFYQGDFGLRKGARRRLVEGYVRAGSISTTGKTTTFTLVEHDGLGEPLKVIYTGRGLPAVFREHDEALARGQLGRDGVFRADQIQARCAWSSPSLPSCLSGTYDPAKPVALKGTVIKMEWAGTGLLHPWLLIAVAGADGKTLEWKCETASRTALFRQGWIPDSLKPGDGVTAEGFRAKDDSSTLIARSVTTAAGKRMYTAY